MELTPKQIVEELDKYIVYIHALKSASLSIGGKIVSREAAELEKAGKQGKYDIFVLHRLVASLAKRVQRPWHEHEDVPHLRRKARRTDLDDPLASLHKHQLHILVPVQRHLRKIPRNRTRIYIEGKTQRTMLLRLLKRCLIFHMILLLTR